MLSYQNLFISLLPLFCCYAAYTDLRERKIKNFCSYGLIYAGILSQVVVVLSGSSSLLNSIFREHLFDASASPDKILRMS